MRRGRLGPSPRAAAAALALAATVLLATALHTPPAQASDPTSRAIFSGGCFWCVEAAFDDVPGVVRTTSGFVGGHVDHPTYEQVSAGGTGHAEAVEVEFDPKRTSYERLLDVFWHNVDPLTAGRQFCDVGDQYRSAIFWLDEDQHRAAVASREAIEKGGRLHGPIVTEILPAGRFWPAEEYHQDYHRKNPAKYRFYRWSCGRDDRLREVWGKAPAH
ncbi:MAG: peptide-methionine (S)-S-oxide reductase MsrA [Alphaproteobacteria bacterium]